MAYIKPPGTPVPDLVWWCCILRLRYHNKSTSTMMTVSWLPLVSAIMLFCCSYVAGDFESDLRVLSKQVTALLERRNEDMKSIEQNVRRTLYESKEIVEMRQEVKNLRLEVEQLRSGKLPKPHYEKNDILTIKWLYNAVAELKTELTEIQNTLNSTSIMESKENIKTQLNLLRNDVTNINDELEEDRQRNARYEADLEIFREEFNNNKDNWRRTAVTCGKLKNQLKAVQLEWNQNWKILNEKAPTLDTEILSHPSRHQKVMKQHIIRLEKSSKSLHKENYFLKSKLLKMDDEIKALTEKLESNEKSNDNDIMNYNTIMPVADTSKTDDQILNITERLTSHNESIMNLTRQISNLDKLHLSMLELLENLETIENKVDKTFPIFRKEISKLEVQVAEAGSANAFLREDQKNVIESLKAITFTVSTMQDKTTEDHKNLEKLQTVVDNLVKSNTVQTSKLHDHILKQESGSVNINATKATIHLVQELKSFESEYKSIVNKLPKDCSAVDGPSGLYLISPGEGEPILARCEDGWTVIQKRYDGSLNFNRNWNEYSNGFGSATGEHWLGNKNLHYLTRQNCSQLKINMKDIYGKYWNANYEDFRVSDYANGFKLYINRYNGNASDALDYQNNMEFSTVDNDRDISNTHCASNYEGGWWFSHCQHANLNGRYNLGLTWFDSSRNEWIAVATSEMRVKRRDVC